MPDLETLLRDVRPEPDPKWAARLDSRVAARFPSKPSRPRRAWLAFRAHFIAFGAVGAIASVFILIVVGLSQVEMGGDDDGGSGGASAPAMSLPTTSPEDATSDNSGSSGASTAVPEKRAATPGGDRAVLRNASITLSTRPGEVEDVTGRAMAIVDGLGGYVESSTVDRDGDRASAELSLKIPSADLDDAMARISKLAHVSARSQQAQDVTDQRERLESLVRDARADRDGLRARLARADTEAERKKLRTALDRASRRVTSRQRNLNQLGREVSYATVALTVQGERDSGGAAAPGDRWTPGDAFGDAVRVLEVIAGVLVIALAIVAPIVILIVLATLGSRLLRQRRRERALGSA